MWRSDSVGLNLSVVLVYRVVVTSLYSRRTAKVATEKVVDTKQIYAGGWRVTSLISRLWRLRLSNHMFIILDLSLPEPLVLASSRRARVDWKTLPAHTRFSTGLITSGRPPCLECPENWDLEAAAKMLASLLGTITQSGDVGCPPHCARDVVLVRSASQWKRRQVIGVTRR